MWDIFGNELAVGDRVAFMEPQYRNLRIGTIVRMTPKKVRVSYMRSGREETYLTNSGDVVKKTE